MDQTAKAKLNQIPISLIKKKNQIPIFQCSMVYILEHTLTNVGLKQKAQVFRTHIYTPTIPYMSQILGKATNLKKHASMCYQRNQWDQTAHAICHRTLAKVVLVFLITITCTTIRICLSNGRKPMIPFRPPSQLGT